jgi:hypothetical protein
MILATEKVRHSPQCSATPGRDLVRWTSRDICYKTFCHYGLSALSTLAVTLIMIFSFANIVISEVSVLLTWEKKVSVKKH